MNGKFATTSSSLFNNNNAEQLPDWMENINVNIKETEVHDLGIQTKGAFANKQTVYREENDAVPRQLEASFTDTKLVTDAKIQLAKFLSGRYYKVTASTSGNSANLNVKIDGIPADFTFNFLAEAGKLNNDSTFAVMHNGELSEYPYSKAGFEECVGDIKSNKVKTSTKVAGVNKTFLINREEIVRRYNGGLREATDKINDLLKAGDIIGVGSNTYASFYDVDYLFPQMEKEAGEERMPEFHFAPNQEHVAAKAYRSEQSLTVDASQMLSHLFPAFEIVNSEKDRDELLVKAKVLNSNGVRKTADFCFGIENAKVASLKFVESDNERLTIEQLLTKLSLDNKVVDRYLQQHTATKRIYRGMVLTEREIKQRLGKLVAHDTMPQIIENWCERALVTPVNSTTFTTTSSFEELLASINTKLLSDEEIATIKEYSKTFGAGLDFERQNVKDTGVREYDDVEASNELRLANLNNHLTRYFKNFEVSNIQSDDYSTNHLADLSFIDQTSGLRHNICLVVGFDVNKVKEVNAVLNETTCPIANLSDKFAKSPILSAYLQDNKANILGSKITISHNNLKRRLLNLVSLEEADRVIGNWYNQGLIKEVEANVYVSDYSVEQLLQSTIANLLSDEDRKQIAIAKRYFGEGLSVEREDVEDTGVREPEGYVSDETMLSKANEFLAKYFNSFTPENVKTDNENLAYTVQVFDEETGLSSTISFMFGFDGNKVASCNANVNGNKIGIENIKKAFATNELLSKYLQKNAGKRVDAPMVMTTTQLRNKLASVSNANLVEIEETIIQWENTGKINKFASNAFGSKHTFEQLLSMSNIKALSDQEVIEKLSKSQREKQLLFRAAHIQDSDTRELVENWSSERMLVHAKAELNKAFKDYEILDASVNHEKAYTVVARVVNPFNGVRQKLHFTFAMVNDKPANILAVGNGDKNFSIDKIERLCMNDKALNTFIQYNSVNKRSYKNLITKAQLSSKLDTVINTANINEITDSLITAEILKPVDSSTFASDYSVSEIVAYLSRFNQTDVEAAHNNKLNAQRDENKFVIADQRTMDNDTRAIEATEKQLSPKMTQVRDKIRATAQKANTQKVITSKKLAQINDMLNSAIEEKDLELAWKELKKYFN